MFELRGGFSDIEQRGVVVRLRVQNTLLLAYIHLIDTNERRSKENWNIVEISTVPKDSFRLVVCVCVRAQVKDTPCETFIHFES